MMSASINYLDVGIIGFILLFVVIGIIRGFTSDFFGLFTWVGAFSLTTRLLPLGQSITRQFIHTIFFADVLAAFVIFVTSLILLVWLVKTIAHVVHSNGLGGLDRSLGIVSGFFRALVLLTAIYMGTLLFWKPGAKPPIVTQSRFEPYLNQTARLASHYLVPKEFMPPKLIQHLYGSFKQENTKTSEELVQSLSSPRPKQVTITPDTSKTK
jgi:uncharacterized membrane protein required for colicin V production